jgi:NTP pyrophosphatase (non-canonical NTP hydrolase)
MDQGTWGTIDRLVTWLDAESPVSAEVARLLRVMKISEEAGEVAEAVHGVMGSNARKGVSHTWEDVQEELCDVILTAMVALSTLTPDAQKVFDKRLSRITERSPI